MFLLVYVGLYNVTSRSNSNVERSKAQISNL